MPQEGAYEPWHDERALRVVLDAMPVGVSWVTVADQKIVYLNRRFTEIFGYVAGEVKSVADWLEHLPVLAERTAARRAWDQSVEPQHAVNPAARPAEVSVTCKDGTIKTVLYHGVLLPEIGFALGTFIDVSEKKRDYLRLQEAEKRAIENEAVALTLLEQSQEMIVIRNFDRSLRHVSPAVYQITGLTPEEFLAMPSHELVYGEDIGVMREAVQGIVSGKPCEVHRARIRHKDGQLRWVEVLLRGSMDRDSKETVGYVAIIRNIDEQKEREDLVAAENRQLSKDAWQDELTGIPNRRLFNRRLMSEVRRQARTTDAMALLMVDVDKFKEYNDHYGHLSGDQRLREVAATLQQTLRRDSDMVARFGGDEFVILLPMTDCAGAKQIAGSILKSIRGLTPPHAKDPKRVLTVSIGIACWPSGKPYRAKSAGRDGLSAILCQDEASA
jgi:diguanylate cyclase (GGDEF)-like protein/PAS domain S-box-containing protein